ncbi:MAG: hypothetical protein U9P38_05085 [Campylobacterota bacterium]|nr:hypothetical protein [Campylobacterota bacterium]
MKHITSLSSGVVLGSAGVAMMSIMGGCEDPSQQQQTQNKFIVIEKQDNGKYIVVEEMPTEGESRAIIREKDENGKVTERFMDEEEMKTLAEQEYQKVQDGTSETISDGNDDGMGLAGTLLAVGAGMLLGSAIANSLSNNKNFAKNSASANRSAYSRSNSSSSTSKSKTKKRSFFGSSSKSSSSSSSRFGG